MIGTPNMRIPSARTTRRPEIAEALRPGLAESDISDKLRESTPATHPARKGPSRRGLLAPGSVRRGTIFGLTTYPGVPMLGLYVYPRKPGSAGAPAGDPGSVDPSHADLRIAARPGHRARNPANVGRGAPCRARSAVSGTATAGRARLD